MKKLLLVLFCFIAVETRAQITDTTKKKDIADTVKKDLLTAPDSVKHLHAKGWTFVPPAAFIAYGGISFVVHPVRQLDYIINNDIKRYYPTGSTKLENYFQFAPVAMVYGLNLVGVEGKDRFLDRSAIWGLSAAIMSGSEFVVKHVTHRLRPNGADHYSFPSGHTGNAFLGAEFLAQEFSQQSAVYTVIGYGFAVTTGVLRMYNHDHWFSDVVAGAGFGILSTKAAYFIYPYIRNKLTKDVDKNGKKIKRSTMIMPSFQDGVPGLAFAKTF